MINVMNIRQKNIPLESVYVGRRYYDIKGSVLGNPFKMESETDRDTVIAQYEEWLRGMIKAGLDERAFQSAGYYPVGDGIINPHLQVSYSIFRSNEPEIHSALMILDEIERLTELARNGNLTLICWCFPKACHADVIKRIIEERLQNDGS